MTPSRALPLDGEVFSLLGSPPEAIGMCGGAMIQTQSLSILDRLLEPVTNTMPVDYAKRLVELRAGPKDQARINELAEKCNEGQLSDDERVEYESYVRAINFISVLQTHAKPALANGSP